MDIISQPNERQEPCEKRSCNAMLTGIYLVTVSVATQEPAVSYSQRPTHRFTHTAPGLTWGITHSLVPEHKINNALHSGFSHANEFYADVN